MEILKWVLGTALGFALGYAIAVNRNPVPSPPVPQRALDTQSMDDVAFGGKIYAMCVEKGGVPTLDSVRWLANGCVFPPSR